MQVTGLKEIYDTFLNKSNYNPVVVNPNETINEILRADLESNKNKAELDWDDLDWLLKKIKHWFYNYSKQQGLHNINYNQYEKYLQTELPNFWEYKNLKIKLSNDPKGKFILTKKLKQNNKNRVLSDDERYVLFNESKFCDIYNTKFNYYNENLIIAIENRLKLWNNPPLTVQQIVNWPHVGFTLDLPDITIVHQATHSYNRYISLVNCNELLNTDIKCISPKFNCPLPSIAEYCNIELITMYLCLCKQAISKIEDIPERRKNELTILFATIIKGLAFYEDTVLPCNTEYNYVCTKYKLTRQFDALYKATNVPDHENVNNAIKLVETITPCFKINITRCNFNQQCSGEVRETILKFFANLFQKGDMYDKFKEQMNKDTLYTCSYCNIKFNESSFYAMENHIQELHGCEDNPWQCMACKKKFTAFELATNNWRHICS